MSRSQSKLTTLRSAIAGLVPDGATVAMEGFTHLIPFAAGHEIIRQRKKGLTLIRMTPDVIYDQLIGAGSARKLIFSWGGNPGVGSLHRLRDAVENGHPSPLKLEEHSHAGMAARYTAGASGLPFAILRAYVGTDLAKHTEMATIRCPFTGEELAAVPALNPDVAIIHAQQVDSSGNVGMWGITGVQKEVALAATTTIVTVEEVVEELVPRGPNHVVLPSWTLTAVAVVPGGAMPSYAMGYSTRVNAFYTEWDEISRDREVFASWIEEHIHRTEDHASFLASIGRGAGRG